MEFIAVSGREKNGISLFEATALSTFVLSATSLFLLVMQRFSALNALLLGAIVFTAVLLIANLSIKIKSTNFDLPLFLILLIALLFRAQPYLWVSGGQDQGLYVNMSATFERTGRIFIKDNVRAELDDQTKQLYDKYNQKDQFDAAKRQEGRYEGWHYPGIYIKDLSRSEYVYQFYHLHPLWMALFAGIFGRGRGVYSLLFFSLLTVYVYYLLAYELSDRKRLPALLAALFMALNPLHAFFSKFPVSEVVSLFFSSTGFYFLIKYFKEMGMGNLRPRYLALSAGMFFCLFYNHISGFLFVPFFYMLLLIVMIFAEEKTMQRHAIRYCLAVFSLFGTSLLYGYFFSYPYFIEVYGQTFGAYLGAGWPAVLGGLVAGLSVVGCIIYVARKQIQLRLSPMVPWACGLIPLLFYGLILVSIYQAYRLGFTDRYAGDVYIRKYDLSHKGFLSIPSASIVVLTSYVSPLLFILSLIAMSTVKNKKNIFLSVVCLYLAEVYLLRIVLEPTVLYQYYYARYLLGELVPGLILVAAIYLGEGFESRALKKTAFWGIVAATSVYFMIASAAQILPRGKESDGVNEALTRIAAHLGEKDTLFIPRSGSHYMEVATPLSNYYGLNVFAVNDVSEIPAIDNDNDKYFLSQIPIKDRSLNLIETIYYKRGMFDHSTKRIPLGFSFPEWTKTNLYLYAFRRPNNRFVIGRYKFLENFYGDRMWTNGRGILKNVGYEVQPEDQYLVMRRAGHVPFADYLKGLNLRIAVNGKQLRYVEMKDNDFYFALDKAVHEIRDIEIMSSTFVPKSRGENLDDRVLGVDVDSLEILRGMPADNIDLMGRGVLENFSGEWTTGRGIVKNIGYSVRPRDKFLILDTMGYSPYAHDLKKLNLAVLVDGKKLIFDRQVGKSYYFKIDQKIKYIDRIEIDSSAFVPAEVMSGSSDRRTLGIDAKSLRIAEK